MFLTLFVLLLAAHFFGDVVFSSSSLSRLKRSHRFFSRFGGLFFHCAIHSFLVGFFLICSSKPWFGGSLLVLLAHFIIDYFRTAIEIRLFGFGNIYIEKSEFNRWIFRRSANPEKMNMKNLTPWLLINVFDQTAHMGSLYVIAMIIC